MKKHLRITFNGKTYDVLAEVLDDVDAGPAPTTAAATASAASAPLRAGPAPGIAAPTKDGLPSPIAGKVVSIDAKVGARVAKGQTVLTLEAMKMNTVISSPSDGTITVVHVNVGDSVEEGQLLMTIG
jgi:glutaconyl-CoA/methylmalonyl-CoA decarboxylase subunit gamma